MLERYKYELGGDGTVQEKKTHDWGGGGGGNIKYSKSNTQSTQRENYAYFKAETGGKN